MRRWDKRLEENSSPIMLSRSLTGNVNNAGTDDFYLAPVITRWHPSFSDCLENGIRELVFLLIEKLDCITYSSCQGHPRSITNQNPPLRYVSIAPRSQEELEVLAYRLSKVVSLVHYSLPKSSCVTVDILQRRVLTGDGPPVEGIDVVFTPNGVITDDIYFHDVEIAYSLVCEAIRTGPITKLPN